MFLPLWNLASFSPYFLQFFTVFLLQSPAQSDEPTGTSEVISIPETYEDTPEETQEDEDSHTIDTLIGFCAQSCMVMQQMQVYIGPYTKQWVFLFF